MSKDWRDSPHVSHLQVLDLHFDFNISPFCCRTSPFSLHDVLPLRIHYHIDWDKQSLPDITIITPFHPSPSLHSTPGFQFDTSDIPTRAGHYFCSFFPSKIVLSIHQIHYCLYTVSYGTPTVDGTKSGKYGGYKKTPRMGMLTRYGCLLGYVCNSRNKLLDLLADF